MSTTLEYTGELVVVTCWCGMAHAIPSALRNFQLRQHNDGKIHEVYCPLGHAHHPAGKGEAERLREQLDAEVVRAAQIEDQLRAEQRAHKATKTRATKTERRVQNGVCPCCNRSFVQLARHMQTKHPDYKP